VSTIKSSGENLKLSSDNTKDIELQHNGSTKVTVKSDGKVGIGESSPFTKLHVKEGDSGATNVWGDTGLVVEGSADARITLLSGTSNIGSIKFGDSGLNRQGGIDYNHNGDAMTFSTVNAERMRIDSAGRVTMPYQPAFSAYDGAANNSSSIYTVQFTTTTVNVGGSYNTSTYRFTAPVSGNYSFSYGWMGNVDEAQRSAFYINGVQKAGQIYSDNTTYDRINGAGIFYLALGDYIEVKNNVQSANHEGNIHVNYRYFTGHLIG
jgi:hypothetical protein